MKKNYFIVLFALLAFALNNYAQEDASQNNTYNMVVKLPDGTTFTINTDDVDEVSFSNGEVIVSGQTLTDLLQRITRQDNRIDSLGMVSEKHEKTLAELLTDMKVTQTLMRDVRSETLTQIATMQSMIVSMQNMIDNLSYYNSALVTEITVLEAKNEAFEQRIADLEMDNMILKARNDVFEQKLTDIMAIIVELKNKQEQKKAITTESLK